VAPAAQGTAAAGRRGKTTRRTRGFHSPPHLGLRWSEECWPRGRREAAAELRGGGAGSSGRGCVVVGGVVGVEGDAQGLLIGGERRWRRGTPVAELDGH